MVLAAVLCLVCGVKVVLLSVYFLLHVVLVQYAGRFILNNFFFRFLIIQVDIQGSRNVQRKIRHFVRNLNVDA